MTAIATRLCGANGIVGDNKVEAQFRGLEAAGFGDLPVCMAKTQLSFSTDPNAKAKGALSRHHVPVRALRLSAGAASSW